MGLCGEILDLLLANSRCANAIDPHLGRLSGALLILLLVEFQRQSIGVSKERESFSGILVDSDRFHSDPRRSKFIHCLLNIGDFKSQVPQAARFWITQSVRRTGERKQFDLASIGYSQIELI